MTSNNRTVTIIGAGLAGLSAAFELHRAGWKLTVLEARERVDGRVHSLRNFSNGLVAEGGGEFIEETHTRMLALAEKFNEPAGRLFFAGEHATPIQGFMEGAVESGQRAVIIMASS